MAKCEKCGRLMNIIHWGRGKDMAICVNSACSVYRQPSQNAFEVFSEPRKASRSAEKRGDRSSLVSFR
jgi:hypothetical protein